VNIEPVRTHMPYGLLVQLAAVALVFVFVFVIEAPRWTKALVTGLLFLSFLWRYGLFLQAAIGVSLSLYFTWFKSRSESD
jgi:hypothetical protein